MRAILSHLALALALFTLSSFVTADFPRDTRHHRRASGQQFLTEEQEEQVKARLAASATDTWVSGTEAEALIELDHPQLSVFSSCYTQYFRGATVPSTPSKVTRIARHWQSQRESNSPTLAGDPIGAAGDPPAITVAYLWAALTDSKGQANAYTKAIRLQMDYLFTDVPKLDDGTISHRAPWEPVQLWDDFVYMAPPAMALWGVYQENTWFIEQAYDQCRLYRKHLRDDSTNLWKHIQRGHWEDDNLWGTGMAWAVAGMTRVAATIRNSDFAENFGSETEDLTKWSMELIEAMVSNIRDDGFLPNNYSELDNTFSDGAHTALVAATIYRLASMDVDGAQDLVHDANRMRQAVYGGLNTGSAWLAPVVDPLDWYVEVKKSPEAQAFVLLMEAAWIDYTST